MKKINNDEIHALFHEYISNQNEENLEKIYLHCKQLIYGVAFSILKNEYDAEDIVQIIILKIQNLNIDKLPTEYEASWLYTITKNESINFLKKNKNNISLDDIYNISDSSDSLNKVIDAEYFNTLLKRLNSIDKEIVTLKIISDLSFSQISKLLNIPIGTIEWRYYKSINSIKIIISNIILFILTLSTGIIRIIMKRNIYIKNQNVAKEEKINSNVNFTENDNFSYDSADIKVHNNKNELSEIQSEVIFEKNEFKTDSITNGLLISATMFFVIAVILIVKNLKNKKK